MFIKINTEWEPRRKRKTDEVEEQIDEYDIEPRVRTLRTLRTEHVRTFFDSTQSQESKSEVCAQEFYVAMHIKTPFDNTLYLSSLSSNLSI